jgi:hypothetical protein
MNARDAAAITASLAPSICYANLALAEGTEHRAQSTAIRCAPSSGRKGATRARSLDARVLAAGLTKKTDWGVRPLVSGLTGMLPAVQQVSRCGAWRANACMPAC